MRICMLELRNGFVLRFSFNDFDAEQVLWREYPSLWRQMIDLAACVKSWNISDAQPSKTTMRRRLPLEVTWAIGQMIWDLTTDQAE